MIKRKTIQRVGSATLVISSILFSYPSYGQASSSDKSVKSEKEEYKVSVTVDKVHTLVAGKKDENALTTVEIEELIPGTFLPGREVTFSLPKGLSSVDKIKVWHNSDLRVETTTSKITIHVPAYRSEEKYKLTATMRLVARIDQEGELKATIKGDGVTESKVLIARVIQGASIEPVKNEKQRPLRLGVQAQPAPDLLFTERVAGAFRKEGNADITFHLPRVGMRFSEVPTVKVIKGDLQIDEHSVQLVEEKELKDDSYSNGITFKIKKESSKPSVIQVSDIKISTNRTMADGLYDLTVWGDALAHEKQLKDSKVMSFPYVSVNGSDEKHEVKREISFSVGELVYYIGHTEKKMNIAPYMKKNHIYAPIHHLAEALGIHENELLWDEASQTMTILKDKKILQLQAGSDIVGINSMKVPIPTDIEMKDAHIMVPLDVVAAFLGVKAKWEPASKKIILS
ncbi:copper amine oxidase N-terminal domain-containing protein [Aneurinibacillus thermoaerophilus]|uniref:Copper amine oxidase N-terminal domain-containing protein n=1 Tax=Aneurinibacillus thermoaerophilus TaxID=143495 RepID=A0A1G7ZEM0_ANETH|nr:MULTISPECIES: copper amine oxidase N-terminal domain-containing protein [Aneurinibacillus]AMA73081.1 hypothetical protein ACH33_09540 [Aneurinibacillus sp. XH2]MED0676562.1 copper amine oxidase N-terminal domain-containing protein [Aneurinibacillus thermoaerophilus]MED0678542.1 copper amine oxidase N-terminal domain-containing protein [Aneurinibacillus thermoaerophilus]MED0757105.1 copper amine oxidase N-terminal domain-containing protein [Aneurinibacillus thermoaerophilus]MED0759374.1 copp